MSNPDRDPFPMSSRAAELLESSIEDKSSSGAGGEWNKMSSTTILDAKTRSSSNQKNESGEASGNDNKISLPNEKDNDEDERMDLEDEDPFFDRPLHDKYPVSTWLNKKANSLFIKLYGNAVPESEIRRILLLSSTLFFMIGGYWLLRSLKDPVITALCGVESIPKAKFLSVFVVLIVVGIYNWLLDSNTPKYKLFFLFGMFYFVIFSCIAYFLTDPEIGLPNAQPNPNRLLGWVNYCAIESFGSVMVSLFWSFTNSNVNVSTAKASYGFIVATAQIGSMLGPLVVSQLADVIGVPACYFLGACCMLCLQGTMLLYVWTYGPGEDDKEKPSDQKKKKKPKAGVMEGLYLCWEHKYIMGLMIISCFFMVQVTIVDYTMKVLARNFFAKEHPCMPNDACWDSVQNLPTGLSEDAVSGFAQFLGVFGLATNMLSFFLSLLGTSAVIRTLGLNSTLVLFPLLCLGAILIVWVFPTLYVVFASMMLLKAFTYSLNNPTKEILYQPTSSAVKYKAKSWIDIFGARGAKALGSVFTNAFSDSLPKLVNGGSFVSLLIGIYLVFNARYMGRTFDEYIESGFIVGEDNSTLEESKFVEITEKQGEEEDTSCAIFEETTSKKEDEKPFNKSDANSV